MNSVVEVLSTRGHMDSLVLWIDHRHDPERTTFDIWSFDCYLEIGHDELSTFV
jgi:hypothetical protein